jgi:hypothetical protein
LNAVFFENPGNAFRKGPAFAAMSLTSDRVETKRGRFLGKGRGVAHPVDLVETGEPDTTPQWDDRTDRGFPGHVGDSRQRRAHRSSFSWAKPIIKKMAAEMIRKYKSLDADPCQLERKRAGGG